MNFIHLKVKLFGGKITVCLKNNFVDIPVLMNFNTIQYNTTSIFPFRKYLRNLKKLQDYQKEGDLLGV